MVDTSNQRFIDWFVFVSNVCIVLCYLSIGSFKLDHIFNIKRKHLSNLKTCICLHFFKSTYALFVCAFFCVSVCIVTKVILSNISNIPYAYIHVLNVSSWGPNVSANVYQKREKENNLCSAETSSFILLNWHWQVFKIYLLFFQGVLYWFLYKNDWWFNLVFYVVPDVSPQKKR